MTNSTITKRYQTTIPEEVREKLRLRPGDTLSWEVFGDQVRVTVTEPEFLKLKGSIKVGFGDPVEDVRRARELMGLATK